MRLNTLVAFGLVALSILAAVLVACSGSDDCTPNALTLRVELDGTAGFADTIVVFSTDPGVEVMQSFPHTPDGPRIFNVDVVWPGGYPAGKTVTLIARAIGATTLLGENVATIHLGDKCSTGFVAINSVTLDAAPDVD